MLDKIFLPGLTASFWKKPPETSSNQGKEGDSPLIGPQIIELIIACSAQMINLLLADTATSLGSQMNIIRVQPRLVKAGSPINLRLTVIKVEGNRIFLDFSCKDSLGLIYEGNYERLVIDKSELKENTYKHFKKAG